MSHNLSQPAAVRESSAKECREMIDDSEDSPVR
jgi:hypothetical protein